MRLANANMASKTAKYFCRFFLLSPVLNEWCSFRVQAPDAALVGECLARPMDFSPVISLLNIVLNEKSDKTSGIF
jgi:hypothetical protein